MKSLLIENGILHIYNNDKRLAEVIDKVGKCKIKPRKNHYFSFLRSIIGQQLSVKVADVIANRFWDFFENEPTPEKIMAAEIESLRKLGMSYAKINYVKDLSEKILIK